MRDTKPNNHDVSQLDESTVIDTLRSQSAQSLHLAFISIHLWADLQESEREYKAKKTWGTWFCLKLAQSTYKTHQKHANKIRRKMKERHNVTN